MPDPIRVLVVEDNDSVLRLVEVMISLEPDLELVGTARSADEALAVTAATTPDVVVLDNQMPGRAGLEIMSELTSLGVHGIVMYSAEAGVELAAQVERAGAVLCLKTGDSTALFDAIRRAAR